MTAKTVANLLISAVLSSAGWIVGCSGGDAPEQQTPTDTEGTFLPSTPTSGGHADGTGTNASTVTSGKDAGGTAEQCVAACEAKYPKGAQLGRAIDTCWQNRCDSCLAMDKGAPVGPDYGSCKNEVYTPSSKCSTCTVKNCCTAWDACFSNAECVALNKCAIACSGN
jgi:hypothetical protein